MSVSAANEALAEYERLHLAAFGFNGRDEAQPMAKQEWMAAVAAETNAIIALWRSEVAAITHPDGASRVTNKNGRRILKLCTLAVRQRCAWAVTVQENEAARFFIQQAEQISTVLEEVQRAWPWVDIEEIEAAERQIKQGKWMDLDTFKNELLKTSR